MVDFDTKFNSNDRYANNTTTRYFSGKSKRMQDKLNELNANNEDEPLLSEVMTLKSESTAVSGDEE